MSTRLAIHSSSCEQAAAVFVVDDASPFRDLEQHEVERRHRALAHDALGEVGERLVDEVGLGAHAGASDGASVPSSSCSRSGRRTTNWNTNRM